jgi:hypothetical protein
MNSNKEHRTKDTTARETSVTIVYQRSGDYFSLPVNSKQTTSVVLTIFEWSLRYQFPAQPPPSNHEPVHSSVHAY